MSEEYVTSNLSKYAQKLIEKYGNSLKRIYDKDKETVLHHAGISANYFFLLFWVAEAEEEMLETLHNYDPNNYRR